MKLRTLPVLLTLALAACSPSAEDEAKMKEMMQLEADQAALIEKSPIDCKKLEGELATFSKSTADKRKEVNAWWNGLSSGKREKLLDSHKDDKYKLAMAMMKAVPCLDAVKQGMKAGD